MSNQIDKLIMVAEKEANLAKISRENEIMSNLEKTRNAFKEAMGDIWLELAPYATEVAKADGTELNYRVFAKDLELVPFNIRCIWRGSSLEVLFSRIGYSSTAIELQRFSEFLLEMRQAFPEWNAKRIQKKVDILVKKLHYGRWMDGTEDPEEAAEVAAELSLLRPEETDRWTILLNAWNTKREEAIAEKKAAEARIKETEDAQEKHKKAYLEYSKQLQEVIFRNQGKIEKFQTKIDVPMKVWKLEYAIVAEDNPELAEIRSAHLSREKPDDEGYWQVLSWGEIKKKRIFNPVSVEGPFGVKPTDKYLGCFRKKWIPEGNCHILYGPLTQNIDELIANLKLEPLPERPEVLDQFDVDHILGSLAIDQNSF